MRMRRQAHPACAETRLAEATMLAPAAAAANAAERCSLPLSLGLTGRFAAAAAPFDDEGAVGIVVRFPAGGGGEAAESWGDARRGDIQVEERSGDAMK